MISSAPPAVVAAAQSYVASTMSAAGDPGVALVIVRRDGRIWCRGFGVDPQGASITCETPFAIASLTKSVTALAVMQLVAKGAIRLDAPVSTYLPAFRTGDTHPITVENLLQQRSGFSTADGLSQMASTIARINSRVAALQGVRLGTIPGSSFVYSNANYDVLGALIEHVSGQDYLAYVNANVFGPLGIAPATDTCANVPRGYMRVFSAPVPAPEFPQLCSDLAAGGLVLDATQYGRYLAAHLDEGRSWSSAILDSSHWRLLHRSAADSPYAMGWFSRTWDDRSVEWHHNGWAPTFHSFVTVFPQRDIAIARFANVNEVPDGGREFSTELGLENIARGEQPPSPPMFPPDLYLRLGLLVALAAIALQLWRPVASARDAVLGASIATAVIVGLVLYIGPQWGWDPRVGFLFSPDLTVLLLVLCTLLAAQLIRCLTWGMLARRRRAT